MSTIGVYYCSMCTVCGRNPCLLLVCTTLVFLLFVATLTSTISVYYFSICTLLMYVYSLRPLPHLLLVCTTLV